LYQRKEKKGRRPQWDPEKNANGETRQEKRLGQCEGKAILMCYFGGVWRTLGGGAAWCMEGRGGQEEGSGKEDIQKGDCRGRI